MWVSWTRSFFLSRYWTCSGAHIKYSKFCSHFLCSLMQQILNRDLHVQMFVYARFTSPRVLFTLVDQQTTEAARGLFSFFCFRMRADSLPMMRRSNKKVNYSWNTWKPNKLCSWMKSWIQFESIVGRINPHYGIRTLDNNLFFSVEKQRDTVISQRRETRWMWIMDMYGKWHACAAIYTISIKYTYMPSQ